MKALRAVLGLPLLLCLAVGLATVALVAWFVPWVPVLHMGVLVYFPYEADGASRYARITGPLSPALGGEWVPGNEIPSDCKKALIASEDAKFFYHNGLDFESLRQSYEGNQRKGQVTRGGSTITQQLVKNAFLSRDRSYVRKLREVVGALMLDATASKENQLAWYFNVVEFGPHVYGVAQAARFYFHKDARALTRRECAQLVAILPSPNRWNASILRKRPTRFFMQRQGTILARMDQVKLGVDQAKRRAISKEDSHAGFGIGERARLAAAQAANETEAEEQSAAGQGPGGDPELDAEAGLTLPTDNPEAPGSLTLPPSHTDPLPTPSAWPTPTTPPALDFDSEETLSNESEDGSAP